MAELAQVLDELVDDAAATEPDVVEWISRGRGPSEPVLPAVAVAFAQRACSTAARGVESPDRPILLAGAWQTPIAWPLLDVAAAAHIAHEHVDEFDHEPRSDVWATAVLADARAALEHRCDPASRLRDLVRDVERELYHAATTLALRAEDAALALDEPQPSPAAAADPCTTALLRAAGHAIAAAFVAPSILATATNGTWANLVNRYYH